MSGTFSSGEGWLPYFTSKRALEDFVVGLAQDYPTNSTYCISPADTATAPYAKFFPQYLHEAQPAQVVADLCFNLATGATSYESGSVIELRDSKHTLGFHV